MVPLGLIYLALEWVLMSSRLASELPDKGALAKPNTRNNNNHIPPEQKGWVQRICTASGIELGN
jgi:hypothetical protein